MNVALINSFLEAYSNVLTEFNVEFKAGKPHLKGNNTLKDQIVVIIGVTGEYKGQVVFNLDSNTALKIVSNMMGGVEVPNFDDMSKSALSELVNMILGNTVTAFYNKGINIDITPPSILMGDNMSLTPKTPTISIPLEFSIGGELVLDITLVEDK